MTTPLLWPTYEPTGWELSKDQQKGKRHDRHRYTSGLKEPVVQKVFDSMGLFRLARVYL